MIAADAFEAWRIGSIKKPELHRYSEKCVRGSGATDNSEQRTAHAKHERVVRSMESDRTL